MTTLLFANQAQTALASPALSTDTVLNLAVGTGIDFPAPAANQMLILTISNALNSAITEIVYCTGISGDAITVERAQEGTLALAWNAGDFVANLLTAGTLKSLLQNNTFTTANRPIPTFVGQYGGYDLTLGIPIWAYQITPSVIWHNAVGTAV